MKIIYKKNVTSPQSQAGKKGQVRDVPNHVAGVLVKGGYAELLKEKNYGTHKRRNPKGKRPKNS